jgi:hypothetical protein
MGEKLWNEPSKIDCVNLLIALSFRTVAEAGNQKAETIKPNE